MALPLLALLLAAVPVGALVIALVVVLRRRPRPTPPVPPLPTVPPAPAPSPPAPYVAPPRGGRPLAEAVTALSEAAPVSLVVAIDSLPPLSQETEDAAYDVIAECLTNTATHSGAARAWVRADHTGRALRLGIGDDGRGGADPDGPGLTAVRTRIEGLGGTVQITSPHGGPTLISFELPTH